MTIISVVPVSADLEVRTFSFSDRHGHRIYRAEAVENGEIIDQAESARLHDLDDFVSEVTEWNLWS